ncbi:ESX secretion-associated protein EspG [Rhodococcus chondri]|uniref:ESX secretion-associated protein EspG n=1 Tax=Rhodococcus chondri TaxID=3065941 RepID=A0ABU7JL21_9NOCA|nr:ESX secretion-associated protein EspG [Rhodococcus sp. CC-R104]MEE2030740.1 ESX secretion-associated protein EspG [Rhodococcus sp. CC-R104]
MSEHLYVVPDVLIAAATELDALALRLEVAVRSADPALDVPPPGAEEVSRLVSRHFGGLAGSFRPAAPLEFGSVSAPTARVSDALTAGAGNPPGTTRRLVEAGVAAGDAAVLGAALAPCRSFAEIVGIRHGDGAKAPVGGPVTVFDTPLGRVVGTSSVAADGTGWTTLSPGTAGFLRQALVALRERCRERSEP